MLDRRNRACQQFWRVQVRNSNCRFQANGLQLQYREYKKKGPSRNIGSPCPAQRCSIQPISVPVGCSGKANAHCSNKLGTFANQFNVFHVLRLLSVKCLQMHMSPCKIAFEKVVGLYAPISFYLLCRQLLHMHKK